MNTYKYIALAALALGFTACSQEDDFTPQEDAVQIASANIATEVQTRVNTLGDGASFENNDRILLVNNSRTNGKNSGTYTYDGTAWKLTEGMVLYASSGTNDFTAYYPASETFTLPTDQSTEAGIMSADRMVATTSGVAKGTAVALRFERQNAKVTITPTFNTQYEGYTITNISDFKIGEITPYLPEGGTAYTAILTPSESGFTVTLKVGQDVLTATSSTVIEAGKHYTFDLKVGKDAVEIVNVSITKWNEININDVESNEYFSPYVNAATMSTEDMKAAVAKILKAQQNDIILTLAADADGDMFTALRTVFAESTVPDGSINLTIAGVKTIPRFGFFDLNDYNNNQKNTAGDKLKSLTLTDAETIENEAFEICRNLTALNIPKAVIINSAAFAGCSSLTSVNLTAAGDITLDSNVFAQITTGQINLVLHEDKESQVTLNDDGTATWQGYTFKSITYSNN